MSKIVHTAAMEALYEKEDSNSFLYAPDRKLRLALKTRCKSTVIALDTDIFARRSYYESLNARAKILHLMRALSQKFPNWIFCGLSAAIVHGLYISWSQMNKIHVLGDGHAFSHAFGMRQTYQPYKTEAMRIEKVQGIPVTDVFRTAYDAARVVSFPEALAILDSLFRFYSIEPSGFRRYINLLGRHKGSKQVFRALEYADFRSENGGESIARGIMIEAGFMPPELQVEFFDQLSGKTRRVDFLWQLTDGSEIIGEFDGRAKYAGEKDHASAASLAVLRDERRRESRLTAGGKSVLRISSDMLLHPELLIQELEYFKVPRAHRKSHCKPYHKD